MWKEKDDEEGLEALKINVPMTTICFHGLSHLFTKMLQSKDNFEMPH